MTRSSSFEFESKLLRGKENALAAMISMSGGRNSKFEISEFLFMAGISNDMQEKDVMETVKEIKYIFSRQSHPFWKLVEKTEYRQPKIEREPATIKDKIGLVIGILLLPFLIFIFGVLI